MSNILEALGNIAEQQTNSRKVGTNGTDLNADSVEQLPEDFKITVDIVENRNRLDVIFSSKPTSQVLAKLKFNGWRFNGDGRYWYHKDTTANRVFLAETFGVFLEPGPKISAIVVEGTEQIPSISQQEAITKIIDSAFARYKLQVDQLSEKLGIDLTAILFKAVDLLYGEVFKNGNL